MRTEDPNAYRLVSLLMPSPHNKNNNTRMSSAEETTKTTKERSVIKPEVDGKKHKADTVYDRASKKVAPGSPMRTDTEVVEKSCNCNEMRTLTQDEIRALYLYQKSLEGVDTEPVIPSGVHKYLQDNYKSIADQALKRRQASKNKDGNRLTEETIQQLTKERATKEAGCAEGRSDSDSIGRSGP